METLIHVPAACQKSQTALACVNDATSHDAPIRTEPMLTARGLQMFTAF